jgi:hypothetical protein
MVNIITENNVISRHPYTHPHICIECKEEFFGRRNRIYCSLTCKTSANNLKAAKRRSGVSDQTRMLEKNSQILGDLCMEKNGPVSTNINKLRELGFRENGPNIRLLDYNNNEWCQVGLYVLKTDSLTGDVIIMTKSYFDNMK